MGLLEILRGEEPGPIKQFLNYENKGQFGEYLTEYAITNHNIPGKLVAFHNLYIPYRGKFSEIDVLMVHEKGIYVFESKNYSGWIFGSATQQMWTQSLRGGVKFKFYNPVLQNQTHVHALADYLGLPRNMFYSCIIFSNRCEFKSIPIEIERCVILQRQDLLRWLRRDLAQKSVQYSPKEMAELAEKLKQTVNKTLEEKMEHVQQVKEDLEHPKCPFCGSPLVLREGKYGQFWGCQAYPRCKYTRKLE